MTKITIDRETAMSVISEDIAQLKNSIEDKEIEVMNGGAITVRVKRDRVIAMSYEAVKPGGSIDTKLSLITNDIDQRIQELKDDVDDSISLCKQHHTFFSSVKRFNKKGGSLKDAIMIIMFFAMLGLTLLIYLHKPPTAEDIKKEIKQEVMNELKK